MLLNNRLKAEDDMYVIIILKESQKISLCYAYMNYDFNMLKMECNQTKKIFCFA